jgi:16S rRNA (cytosine1402-N4)-methyltransferase
VLFDEVFSTLDPRPGEIAVDCTLGAAGHAAELLRRIGPGGKLIACDLDPGNLDRARPILDVIGHPYELHATNFAGVATLVPDGADMLLVDLGVSSMQIDDAARGFSYMRDGPLDMRMDPTRGKTAAQHLGTLNVDELTQLFEEWGDFGEFGPTAARKLAETIVEHRASKALHQTKELTNLILATIKPPPPPPSRRPPTARQLAFRPVACAFQALRILVNRELANLQALLRSLPTILQPGARAAIISFHSGEDRLVKQAFRDGQRTGVYAEVSPDAIRASGQERFDNPRSRSAKLRWARK